MLGTVELDTIDRMNPLHEPVRHHPGSPRHLQRPPTTHTRASDALRGVLRVRVGSDTAPTPLDALYGSLRSREATSGPITEPQRVNDTTAAG